MDTAHTQYLLDNFTFWSGRVLTDQFDCGDGWFGLLKGACEKIAYLKPSRDFTITQVKEKFGALRIYCSAPTPDIERIILNAENASAQTCEYCGSPGFTRKKGPLSIYKTVCTFHDVLYAKERAWPSA